jgi:hypothetical protein
MRRFSSMSQGRVAMHTRQCTDGIFPSPPLPAPGLVRRRARAQAHAGGNSLAPPEGLPTGPRERLTLIKKITRRLDTGGVLEV